MKTDSIDISLKGLSVMIGMPTRPDMSAHTLSCILSTYRRLDKLHVPFDIGLVIGSSVVNWARDDVVDIFLKSDANRLFWVDSDMLWRADDFIRLLALSTLVPVVGAAYPAKIEGAVTFFLQHSGIVIGDYGLAEVEGLGLGFTVMQREVIEAVAAKAPRARDEITGRDIASVFRIDTHNGNRRGEDIAFFHDIRDAGYKVLLDPEVSLGHVGTKIYTGSIKDAFQDVFKK